MRVKKVVAARTWLRKRDLVNGDCSIVYRKGGGVVEYVVHRY